MTRRERASEVCPATHHRPGRLHTPSSRKGSQRLRRRANQAGDGARRSAKQGDAQAAGGLARSVAGETGGQAAGSSSAAGQRRRRRSRRRPRGQRAAGGGRRAAGRRGGQRSAGGEQRGGQRRQHRRQQSREQGGRRRREGRAAATRDSGGRAERRRGRQYAVRSTQYRRHVRPCTYRSVQQRTPSRASRARRARRGHAEPTQSRRRADADETQQQQLGRVRSGD